MRYRFILSILFLVEMILGSALVCYGGGMFGGSANSFLIGLGISVFLLHALQYLLLSRIQMVGETCPMCHGSGSKIVTSNGSKDYSPVCPKCGGSGKRL